MKTTLERCTPHFFLTQDQVQACLESYKKNIKLINFYLAPSGLSNTNYIVTIEEEKKLILRIHRDKASNIGLKEYNISKLLTSFPLVPQVFFFKPSQEDGFSYSILEYKEGIPLSERIVQDKSFLREVYFELGSTLAELQKIKFKTIGLLNEELAIISIKTKNSGFHPVINFIMDCLENESLQKRIERPLIQKIQQLVIQNESLLYEIKQDLHLVHGDFKIENILVENSSKKIHLTGILDWEHARADTIYGDIATLFRGDYDQKSILKRAFLEGLEASGEHLISTWDRLGKIIDLINLCHFLCSKEERSLFYKMVIKHLEHTIQYMKE